MILLAQSTPQPAALHDWLVVFAWLIGIAYGLKRLFFEKSTPQPLKVSADSGFVTNDAHEKAINKIELELKRHQARRAEIYEKQEAMGIQLAQVETKTDTNHAQLLNLDAKIDRVLERLPRKS